MDESKPREDCKPTCTQEEVDEKVKNKWEPWLKDAVSAVDDTEGEGKLSRMNKEQHADGVTFGLMPEDQQAEDHSRDVEQYDWVCTVIEKVKASCGLWETAEEEPWQAVCALGEESMHQVLVVEPGGGIATRTRGNTKKEARGQDGEAGAETCSGAEEDGIRAAQEA